MVVLRLAFACEIVAILVDRNIEGMKKTALVLTLLSTFSLPVFAQDAAKPAATTTPDAVTTSTTKKHSHKQHKASKTAPADATKTPAENTRYHPYGKDLLQ